MDDALLGMALELLIAPQLDKVEKLWPHRIALSRRRDARCFNGLALGIRCVLGSVPYDLVLTMDPLLARDACGLLLRIPVMVRDLSDLTTPLTFRLGRTTLPMAEVRTLRPGDVILPHSPPLIDAKVDLVVGDRFVAAGHIAERTITAAGPLRDTKEPSMDSEHTHATGTAEVEDGTLDELALTLTFEAGRCEIDLGTLKSLGAGHVFALGRDPEYAVDIVAGGRRIGTGELVRIGERLGVRVVRLRQDG